MLYIVITAHTAICYDLLLNAWRATEHSRQTDWLKLDRDLACLEECASLRTWRLFREKGSKVKDQTWVWSSPTAVLVLQQYSYIHTIPITEGVNGNSMLHPHEGEGLNPLVKKKEQSIPLMQRDSITCKKEVSVSPAPAGMLLYALRGACRDLDLRHVCHGLLKQQGENTGTSLLALKGGQLGCLKSKPGLVARPL